MYKKVSCSGGIGSKLNKALELNVKGKEICAQLKEKLCYIARNNNF